jgi:hypothetical protein
LNVQVFRQATLSRGVDSRSASVVRVKQSAQSKVKIKLKAHGVSKHQTVGSMTRRHISEDWKLKQNCFKDLNSPLLTLK